MIHFFGMAQLMNEYVFGNLWFNHQEPRIEADVPVDRTASPACSLNPHTRTSKTQAAALAHSGKPWQQELLPSQRQPGAQKSRRSNRITKIADELQRKGWRLFKARSVDLGGRRII